MPESNVTPWHTVGDILSAGPTVKVKSGTKVEQMPPKSSKPPVTPQK